MDKRKVARMLANGIHPSAVASVIGCAPGRISQLKNDPEFQNILAEIQAESENEESEEKNLNVKYEAVEHSLLNRVLELAPVEDLRNVTGALRVIAERQENFKKRINPVPLPNNPMHLHQTVIQLNLPQHAIPEIQYSPTKEVIAIGNQALAPMSSTGVKNLFAAIKEKRKEDTISTVPTLPDNSSGTVIPIDDEVF